jgi:CubicO group peptidase (beta-lactamase class C family)
MLKDVKRIRAVARNSAVLLWLVSALSTCCSVAAAQDANGGSVRKDYTEVVDALRPFIQQQMAEKGLPALSIAIIDDQQIVWAQGFGMADPQKKIPATANTVYRIGSVSKLFTDIAITSQIFIPKILLARPSRFGN